MISTFRRVLFCPFGLCQTFRQASDDTGVWGECTKCGKRSGFVDREALRAYTARAECAVAGHDWQFGWGPDMRDTPIEDDGTLMAPDDNQTICRRCGAYGRKRVGVR